MPSNLGGIFIYTRFNKTLLLIFARILKLWN